jgi:hypothetical protein
VIGSEGGVRVGEEDGRGEDQAEVMVVLEARYSSVSGDQLLADGYTQQV